jgi:hypothetical protein
MAGRGQSGACFEHYLVALRNVWDGIGSKLT